MTQGTSEQHRDGVLEQRPTALGFGGLCLGRLQLCLSLCDVGGRHHADPITVLRHLQRSLVGLDGIVEQGDLRFGRPHAQIGLREGSLQRQPNGGQIKLAGLEPGACAFNLRAQPSPEVGLPADSGRWGVDRTGGRRRGAAAPGCRNARADRWQQGRPRGVECCARRAILGECSPKILISGAHLRLQAVQDLIAKQLPPRLGYLRRRASWFEKCGLLELTDAGTLVGIVTRPDLADRAVFLTLEPIPEESRWPEAELWSAFEAERPRLLGVLLDAVVEGIKRLPTTHLERPPHMADFTLWATACETAIWPTGTFLAAYSGNRDEAVEGVIEADSVASAVCVFMAMRAVWTGKAADLLDALGQVVGEKGAKAKNWPDSPRALSGRLHRAAISLRKIGIEIGFGREGRPRTRTITITTHSATENDGIPEPSRLDSDLFERDLHPCDGVHAALHHVPHHFPAGRFRVHQPDHLPHRCARQRARAIRRAVSPEAAARSMRAM